MKQQLTIGFTLILITLSLVFAGFATAMESDELLDQETIITGMVEQEGDTFVLQAIDGYQYTITGQDLSDLVGKKVQATGEFIKEKDVNKFNINQIVELPDETVKLYLPFEAGHH